MLSYEIMNNAETKEAPHFGCRHYRHRLLPPQTTAMDLEPTSYPSWGQDCLPAFSHREFGNPRPPEIGLTDDPNDLLHLFMSDDLPSPPPSHPSPSPFLPPPPTACSLPTFFPPPPSSSSSFTFPSHPLPTTTPPQPSSLVQPASNTECSNLDEPFLMQFTDLDYIFKDLDFTELNQDIGTGLSYQHSGVPSKADGTNGSVCAASQPNQLQLMTPSSDESAPPLNANAVTAASSPLTPSVTSSEPAGTPLTPVGPGVSVETYSYDCTGGNSGSSVASSVHSPSSTPFTSFAFDFEAAGCVFYCGNDNENIDGGAFEGRGVAEPGSVGGDPVSPAVDDDGDRCFDGFVMMEAAQILTREQFAVLHDHNYTSEPTHSSSSSSSSSSCGPHASSRHDSCTSSLLNTNVTASLSTTPLSSSSATSPLPLLSLALHNTIDPSSSSSSSSIMDANQLHTTSSSKNNTSGASSMRSCERYLKRRMKNNVASQASRAKRKAKRCELFDRERQLLRENKLLRAQLEEMTAEAAKLNRLLVQRLAK